jgi:hypothetical protein
MMRRWLILGFVTGVLTLCAGGAHKFSAWVMWQSEAIAAIEQAQDELERLGVSGKVTDIAPSRSCLTVAGHVRTDGGTLPFTVNFRYGQNKERRVSNVTVGAKTLLPQSGEQPHRATSQPGQAD